MQLDDIPVLQDVVAFDHNAVELAGAPDASVFQLFGEVLVHGGGGILQRAPLFQNDGVGHVRLAAGCLGVDPDNLEHPVNSEPELVESPPEGGDGNNGQLPAVPTL